MNPEQLIEKAKECLDETLYEKSQSYALICIGQALIIIARELRKFNDRADIEIERQELIQARKERSKEIW